MTGWNDTQIREFSKRFAYANKAAWHAYVADVREALIDNFIMTIVLGQDGDDVAVGDIRSLRNRLGQRLASKHAMPNPIAELVQ